MLFTLVDDIKSSSIIFKWWGIPRFPSALQIKANNKQAAGLSLREFQQEGKGGRGLVISPDCEGHQLPNSIAILFYAIKSACKLHQQMQVTYSPLAGCPWLASADADDNLRADINTCSSCSKSGMTWSSITDIRRHSACSIGNPCLVADKTWSHTCYS